MPAIQWRNVDAPDFSNSIAAYKLGADQLSAAFDAAKSGLKGFEDRKIRETSNSLMADLMTKYAGDPDALNKAAMDGSLLAGYNRNNLSAEAIAAIGGRQQDLQNFRQGTSNIAGIDKRNRGLDIQNDTGEINLDDLRYNSNNTRTDTNWLRGTGRDFAREFDRIVSTKGRDEAIKWAALPAQQDRLATGAPTDYVRSITDRGSAVPMDQAKLIDQTVVTEGRREDILTAPTVRAVNTASARQGNANAGSTELATDITRRADVAGRIAYDVMTPILQNSKGNTIEAERQLEIQIRTNPALRGNSQAQAAARGMLGTNGYKPYAPIIDPSTGKEISNGDLDPTLAVPAAPEYSLPAPAGRGGQSRPGMTPASAALEAGATPVDTNNMSWEQIAAVNAQELEAAANPGMIRPASFGGAPNQAAAMLQQAGAPRIAPNRVMNYEARALGINEVPANVRTLGQASEFAKQVNRAGADSSAMGTYQIVGDTMRRYAPKVFGEKNWKSQPYDDAAQYRLGGAIFQDNRGSAAALKKQWVSLTTAEAEVVRKMPWAQASRIIASKESGNGTVAVPRGVRAEQNLGAIPDAMATPISPIMAALNGPVALQNASQAISSAPTEEAVRAGVDPRDELLRQFMADRENPKPVMVTQADPRRRRYSTNVAALLGQAEALSRYS